MVKPKEKKTGNLPLYLFHQGTNFKAYEYLGAHPQRGRRGLEDGYTSVSYTHLSAGRASPKYFSAMATERETRLPRSLARSALMRVIRLSFENRPSEPNGNSRSRK